MNHAQMRPLYVSPNGDAWFLARDPATVAVFVRHEANRPSGGQVTDIEIDTFLSGPINPEPPVTKTVLMIPPRSGRGPDALPVQPHCDIVRAVGSVFQTR